MTKKLETLLNIPNSADSEIIDPSKETPIVKLQDFDKISTALPKVSGLGEISDYELDHLATKAESAFDDLMDLGMNVEPRFSGRMFEVAGNMLKTAVEAKSAKIDKKLKMVELQIKKLAIDKKHTADPEDPVAANGYIISDRNSLLEKLKNMDK